MKDVKPIFINDTKEDIEDEKIDDFFGVLNKIRNRLEKKKGLSPLFILCSYGMIIAPLDKIDEVQEYKERIAAAGPV